MQEKKYNDAKKEIRGLLLTYHKGVTLEIFLKTYRSMLGERLPSKALGFPSDVAFLKSMPDVVSVHTDLSGKVQLTGIANEETSHIQKLVSKQRVTKPNNKSCKRQPALRPVTNNVLNVKQTPFLRGPLRAEILQLMARYPTGVNFSCFALAYRRKFHKCLPLVTGLETLEDMIKLIPQLEIQTINNEKRICYKNGEFPATCNSEKDLPVSLGNDENVQHMESSCNVHESGISDDILESFQQLLQKCPGGIIDIHFPALYERITGKSFDLHEFGYNSILDLVDALPHIFRRIRNEEGNRSWIILPADNSSRQDLIVADNLKTPNNRKQISSKTVGIPADASSPVLQYIQPFIPKNVDLTKYMPVYVSAIINPSLFWFQLQTDEAAINFEKLEKDIGTFYDSESYKYKMNDADVVIGASCVILCPDDKQWYRAIIKSIPNIHSVNVSYTDYGSEENIPKDNLFYVRSQYHDYPACAFKAQLARVKPLNNEYTWSFECRQRFVELCSCGILMANLKSINKDTYSVYLCDTNGEEDIHINDVLVKEEFAEWKYDNDVDPEEIAIPNGFKSDSASELFSLSDQDMLQSDKNDSFSESENAPLNRRLSFSPKNIQCNTISPSTTSRGSEQHSKRFVKLLELCEETKIHFINLENKLYMSCAGISKLIWSDKNSNVLLERLKYKEVDVPFIKILKEEHAELFTQCIWYKIPEFETLKSDSSSLILCPLEWTLNILNVFGHPSVCLRLAIQDEIRRFDPCDPIWKEFHFEESCDIEEEIEQSISKLCLYDLRAKNEALKIKRLKILRLQNNPENDDIKMIEVHQKVLERRMKQIEAVCSQYSSC